MVRALRYGPQSPLLDTHYVMFMGFNLCQISILLEVYKLGEILNFKRKSIKSQFNLLHITYVTLDFAV